MEISLAYDTVVVATRGEKPQVRNSGPESPNSYYMYIQAGPSLPSLLVFDLEVSGLATCGPASHDCQRVCSYAFGKTIGFPLAMFVSCC